MGTFALLLPVLAFLPAAAFAQCSCSGCNDSSLIKVGDAVSVDSPVCAEGSVATVTKLNSMSKSHDNGLYDVVTSNLASVGPLPYIYFYESVRDTMCFDVDASELPVIGDNPDIRVTFECHAETDCDLEWVVENGCLETGVLMDQAAKGGGIQILSDIDDTIKCTNPTCSGRDCKSNADYFTQMAGIDNSLEHGEMYPGMSELYLGMSLGPGYDVLSDSPWFTPPHPMLLTARWREASIVMALEQDGKINTNFELVGERYNQTWGANLDGSWYGTISDQSFQEMGKTKAESYNIVSEERPNTRFVFFGDNGQGDVCAGQSMLNSATSDQMMAVLIHEVAEDPITDCIEPNGTAVPLDLPEGDKVHYFTEHSEATQWAFERDFISCCSAANVYNAVKEWHDCRCEGNCPNVLATGVSEQTTKEETLDYCDRMATAQVSLLDALKVCDPDGNCPNPPPLTPTAEELTVEAGRDEETGKIESPESDEPCFCSGCTNSSLVKLDDYVDIDSPTCTEGSVATVTKLSSSSDSGEYNVFTWNIDSPSPVPYVYFLASDMETKCFDQDASLLPVVGDNPNIRVTFECMSGTDCDLQWVVENGCLETGVLVDQAAEGGGVQIMSDIDDTIKCSAPACSGRDCKNGREYLLYMEGVDQSLEHGELYPGMSELYLGMSLGPGYDVLSDSPWFVPSQPMLLTARWREVTVKLALDQDGKINTYFQLVGERYNQTWGANLDGSSYGKISDGQNFQERGRTKAESYNIVSEERPNTRFVFFGDDTQGDACAGQSMLNSANSDRMMAVLIRKVEEVPITDCIEPDGTAVPLDLPEGDKVHYFTEHSEATQWALERGFIACCSAANVYDAVKEWHDCRCAGNCPNVLGTGVSEQTTKEETLEYCDRVAAAQLNLLDALNVCDPEGKCPNVAPITPKMDDTEDTKEDKEEDTEDYEEFSSAAQLVTTASIGLVSALLGLLWFN